MIIIFPLSFLLILVAGGMILAWSSMVGEILYKIIYTFIDIFAGLFPNMSRKQKMRVVKIKGKYRIVDKHYLPIRFVGHAIDDGGYSSKEDAEKHIEDINIHKLNSQYTYAQNIDMFALLSNTLGLFGMLAILSVPLIASIFPNGIWAALGLLLLAIILYLMDM